MSASKLNCIQTFGSFTRCHLCGLHEVSSSIISRSAGWGYILAYSFVNSLADNLPMLFSHVSLVQEMRPPPYRGCAITCSCLTVELVYQPKDVFRIRTTTLSLAFFRYVR